MFANTESPKAWLRFTVSVVSYLLIASIYVAYSTHAKIPLLLSVGSLIICLMFGGFFVGVMEEVSKKQGESVPIHTRLRWYKMGLVLALSPLLFFSGLLLYNESSNRNSAVLETKIYSMGSSMCTGDCGFPEHNTNAKAEWWYIFTTTADGLECDDIGGRRAVRVDYEVHECPRGYKEISEAQWRKLHVGQVLKVVELK